MRLKRLVHFSAVLLLLGTLAGCGESDSALSDVCSIEAYGNGSCTTIDKCCTASRDACYIKAQGQRFECPAKNCVDSGLLAEIAAACGVDGDADTSDSDTADPDLADHDPVLDGDVTETETDAVVEDGDTTEADTVAEDGDTADPDPGSAPASHTDNQNGVRHNTGKDDPLNNCTGCHGDQLTGGSGPSCYSCHNNDDHAISHHGKNHKSGTSASCRACHGPQNNGGLGPACSVCHN